MTKQLISESSVKAFIAAVDNALTTDEDAYYAMFGKDIDNGKYSRQWNFIYRNMKSNMVRHDHIAFKVERGHLWTLVSTLDLNTGYVYACMKKKTYESLKGKKREDRMNHYVSTLGVLNDGLNAIEDQQIPAFGNSCDELIEEEKLIVKRRLEQIADYYGEYVDEIKGFVLLTMEIQKRQLVGLEAIMPNSDLRNTVQPVDLSDWIDLDYEEQSTPSKPADVFKVSTPELAVKKILKPATANDGVRNVSVISKDNTNEVKVK